VYQSSHVYQDCTNRVPTVYKSSKQSKDSQHSKNDHWCTNRHRPTKTVPTVYQSSKTLKRQVKTATMIVGVPIVTCLHRVQCTSSVPVVKNTQKTSQNSNNDRWCTNCHMSTQSAEYTSPHPRPPNTQSR